MALINKSLLDLLEANVSNLLLSLEEARRNPEMNPYISTWEALNKYKDNPNVFISFTQIPKLGINPKSKYDTPLGIYTYPLQAIWGKYAVDVRYKDKWDDIVPFAGKAPYVWITEGRGNVIQVHEYTRTDFQQDVAKLQRSYFQLLLEAEKKSARWEDEFEEVLAEEVEVDFKSIVESASSSASVNNPFGHIWYVLMTLSQKLYSNRLGPQTKAHVWWNILCRKSLGWDGVIDLYGSGIIHPAEPIQAVFFHKKALKVLEMIANRSTHKVAPRWEKIHDGSRATKWEFGSSYGGISQKGLPNMIEISKETGHIELKWNSHHASSNKYQLNRVTLSSSGQILDIEGALGGYKSTATNGSIEVYMGGTSWTKETSIDRSSVVWIKSKDRKTEKLVAKKGREILSVRDKSRGVDEWGGKGRISDEFQTLGLKIFDEIRQEAKQVKEEVFQSYPNAALFQSMVDTIKQQLPKETSE